MKPLLRATRLRASDLTNENASYFHLSIQRKTCRHRIDRFDGSADCDCRCLLAPASRQSESWMATHVPSRITIARPTSDPGMLGRMPRDPAGRRRRSRRGAHAPPASTLLAATLALFALWSAPGRALQLGALDVAGIGGEAQANVVARLSLSHHPADQELTEARLAWLLRRAPGEVLTALEPFGFYDAQVAIESPRSGDVVHVRVLVRPGRPAEVPEA